MSARRGGIKAIISSKGNILHPFFHNDITSLLNVFDDFVCKELYTTLKTHITEVRPFLCMSRY